ncbi:hypothetical protein WICMUC_000150 [Wickerhamomyces mucosus]|uniref:Uncharacterized protein n=1 Tax=Wickerhamomyces mucosus TaxID=1378264 RepID=A0A9P8Q0X3_9ASCO|nr:hypothetical protein WICMUC_000150 [Wickerhamomyces mucosus]
MLVLTSFVVGAGVDLATDALALEAEEEFESVVSNSSSVVEWYLEKAIAVVGTGMNLYEIKITIIIVESIINNVHVIIKITPIIVIVELILLRLIQLLLLLLNHLLWCQLCIDSLLSSLNQLLRS